MAGKDKLTDEEIISIERVDIPGDEKVEEKSQGDDKKGTVHTPEWVKQRKRDGSSDIKK